jgi:hypothetical protein
MLRHLERNPILGGVLLGIAWSWGITYLWDGNVDGMTLVLIGFSLLVTIGSEYLLRKKSVNSASDNQEQ